MAQASKGERHEKCQAYRARESESFIQDHADRMAAREAEARDNALDAIDEALTRFRADMRRTEKKLIGGEWVEVPVMLIGPKDVALLIDRFQVRIPRKPISQSGVFDHPRSEAAKRSTESLVSAPDGHPLSSLSG